jgi:hypothetical protein
MSRAPFQKSVRMFHKFSEETLRRRGGNQAGRDGVVALANIEAALRAEKPFDPALLEPLSAFTNLLQSAQLPPEFGNFSLGDALLAIEEAQAELRQHDDQRWEFQPELGSEEAPRVLPFAPRPSAPSNAEHEGKLRRFVLEAAARCEPRSVLVVGALAAPELPLGELAARAERLTLNDVDLDGLEQLVRRAIPEEHRGRVRVERYDATGSYLAFATSVETAVRSASTEAEAQDNLSALLQSYDVGAGSAGLSAAEEKPDLAISAMLLSALGNGYAPAMARALAGRGFDAAATERSPIAASLTFFRCLVEQHHIQALLRRAKAAVLISAVSEVVLRGGPHSNGKDVAEGDPRDLLAVERLSERLPQIAEARAEESWEFRAPFPTPSQNRSLLTLVEAVLL